MTPGAQAIIAWSRTIHTPGSDRDEWCRNLAVHLDEHDGNLHFAYHRFPSRYGSTRLSRLETALRLYDEANGIERGGDS